MTTSLSSREQEVLSLIAKEQNMHEIASTLYISSHTVASHRKNLLRKLNARNTAGLMVRAFRLGLIPVLQLNATVRN